MLECVLQTTYRKGPYFSPALLRHKCSCPFCTFAVIAWELSNNSCLETIIHMRQILWHQYCHKLHGNILKKKNSIGMLCPRRSANNHELVQYSMCWYISLVDCSSTVQAQWAAAVAVSWCMWWTWRRSLTLLQGERIKKLYCPIRQALMGG